MHNDIMVEGCQEEQEQQEQMLIPALLPLEIIQKHDCVVLVHVRPRA